MRFSIAATVALVAGASAWSNTTVYTTEVVTAYTTYCPSATAITHGTNTYVVTEATTLTITDCPCTVTKPYSVSSVTYCPTCPASSATPTTTYSVGPVSSPVVSPIYANSTVATSGVASASVAPTSSTPAAATFTGAANQVFAASGASLAGLLGLAAYIL